MTEQQTLGRLTSRSIRSFVIRNGRLTKAQAAAIQNLLPKFGIAYQEERLLDLTSLFSLPTKGSDSQELTTPDTDDEAPVQPAPVWLEIGFGNGDALLDMAKRYPCTHFIGVEVHEPGVGQALMGIESDALLNVRIIQHDAMEVLLNMIPDASLERVLLFFPDPWRKKRHFKRRIVQKEFIELVTDKLCTGGVLHCATDWQDYALWMVEKLNACDRLTNQSNSGDYSERPEWRTKTRFEQRGERLGHDVFDLLYLKP